MLGVECWYCFWGWAKSVAELYRATVKKLGSNFPLICGPAHVVWSDENWDTDIIESCLEEQFSSETVRQSLVDLLKIPEEIRCCQPANYDGKYPENYPPKVEVVNKQRPGAICLNCRTDLEYYGLWLTRCPSCFQIRMNRYAKILYQESAKTMWYIQLPNGQWFRENGCGAVDCSSLRALNGEKPFLIHLGRPDGEIREIV